MKFLVSLVTILSLGMLVSCGMGEPKSVAKNTGSTEPGDILALPFIAGVVKLSRTVSQVVYEDTAIEGVSAPSKRVNIETMQVALLVNYAADNSVDNVKMMLINLDDKRDDWWCSDEFTRENSTFKEYGEQRGNISTNHLNIQHGNLNVAIATRPSSSSSGEVSHSLHSLTISTATSSGHANAEQGYNFVDFEAVEDDASADFIQKYFSDPDSCIERDPPYFLPRAQHIYGTAKLATFVDIKRSNENAGGEKQVTKPVAIAVTFGRGTEVGSIMFRELNVNNQEIFFCPVMLTRSSATFSSSIIKEAGSDTTNEIKLTRVISAERGNMIVQVSVDATSGDISSFRLKEGEVTYYFDSSEGSFVRVDNDDDNAVDNFLDQHFNTADINTCAALHQQL